MPPTDEKDPQVEPIEVNPGSDPKEPTGDSVPMKRYVGLQRNYQKQVDRIAELEVENEKLMSDLEETRQSMKTLEGQFGKTKEDLGASANLYEDLLEQHDELKAKLDRKDLIIKEFPELADFEASGLLPDKEGDDLRTALKAFGEALDTRTKKKAEDMLKTSTPPEPPAEPPEETQADLYEQAMKAAGDPEKFNTIMPKYMELIPDSQE